MPWCRDTSFAMVGDVLQIRPAKMIRMLASGTHTIGVDCIAPLTCHIGTGLISNHCSSGNAVHVKVRLSCHLVNSECFVTVTLVPCTRHFPCACRVSKTVNDFLFADGHQITINPPRADRNKNVLFRKGEIFDCWVGKVSSDLKIQLPKICVWVRNR